MRCLCLRNAHLCVTYVATSLSWDEKWTWNHRDFYIFIVRNKRFCAMEVLVGRPIRVPRAVFSEDIRRGCTKEPPDGTHWDGSITAFSGVGSRPFSIVLTVLDPDDDDDKLMQEELDEGATLRQVRDWISDLCEHEDRAQLGSTMRPRSTPRHQRGLNDTMFEGALLTSLITNTARICLLHGMCVQCSAAGCSAHEPATCCCKCTD